MLERIVKIINTLFVNAKCHAESMAQQSNYAQTSPPVLASGLQSRVAIQLRTHLLPPLRGAKRRSNPEKFQTCVVSFWVASLRSR